MASLLFSVRSDAKDHSYGIHWTTCATMLTAWASGVLLAVGHHLFYNSLDGTSVSNGYFLHGLSKQQLTFALGTMFAFLANSLLALALSTSYLQVVWKAIKERETPLPIIDTFFSGTITIYSLWRLDVWWKHPLLFLLAFAFWCIPISSVITPATLSVEFAAQIPPPTVPLAVPNVDFLSLNFANIVRMEAVSSAWLYNGPQWAVRKVAVGTAAQGSILPLDHPHANASWMLEFSGPSLTCTDIQGQQLDAIIQNINRTVKADACTFAYGYISWTPDGTDYLPFIQQADNESLTLRTATLGSGAFSHLDIPDAASLYVATLPGMEGVWGNDKCDVNSQLINATVVQCALFNTSYQASFEFTNGLQVISVNRNENFHNAVVPIQVLNPLAVDPPLSEVFPNGTAIQNTYNLTEVQTLAYQSVMDALGQILVGLISISEDDGAPLVDSTSVMSTVLSDTSELHSLASYPSTGTVTSSTLQQFVALDPSLYNGLSISKPAFSPDTIHLDQALESLFENITIGLMSSALLQPNISSPYAPPLTDTTLPYFRNIYIYSTWKLWVAYGVSISVSTLGVMIGLLTMLSNGGSYNRDFSTVFRAARHATINTNIHPADAIGKEPLPNYLAQATVSFLATESKNHDGASGAEYKYAQIPLTPKSADASSDLLGPRADGFEGRS